MDHRQIDGPFDVERVAARLQGAVNGGSRSQGLPEPAEHQVRADPLHPDRFGLAGGVRVEDGQVLAETQAGTEQGLQLAALACRTSRRLTVVSTRWRTWRASRKLSTICK